MFSPNELKLCMQGGLVTLLGCAKTTLVLGHTVSNLQLLEDGTFQKLFLDRFMLKSAIYMVIWC